MFLNSCRWRASRVLGVADRGERYAERRDVVAELRRRQRLGRVVEQIAAGLDLGDVLVPRLRIHRDHEVDAAAAAAPAVLDDAHLVPRRQALDVGRKDVARGHRHAHAQDRLGEQAVRRRRARAVDVGELDDEIVDAGERSMIRLGHHRWLRRDAAACTVAPACARQRSSGLRHLEQELLHVPRAGRAPLGAQAAVQAARPRPSPSRGRS